MGIALRLAACLALMAPALAWAQSPPPTPPPSRCLAVADAAPPTIRAAYVPAALAADEVRIRFVGHSTFLIESPDGITVATDYAGWTGGVVPDVATMNRAHSSHYTDRPDPAIRHVLRGWNPDGGPAEHNLQVGDVVIRSVPTDIRGARLGRVPDGNSIFIFEVADLCIGHLGHLHHVLAPEDLAWIGQLDVVMVAVDGAYTMDHASVVETLEVVKARLVLPMHYFGAPTLNRFLSRLDERFEVRMHPEPEIVVSAATLPETPTVLVLPGY